MKNKILDKLKENSTEFISGENLSKELGVTRAAIWKHINGLKEEGYEIESVSKKGYRIISSPDKLNENEINEILETNYIGKKIIHYDTIDSTNKVAKNLAYNGAETGTVIISEEQTLGRGRLGRNWSSPKGKTISMSIILKPNIPTVIAPKATILGAAAVYCGLEDMGIHTQIKWPNDIILNGKKVCGILTEMSGEMDKLNYIVMGIGINVNSEEEDFDDEIKIKATSLKIEEGREVNRKQVVAKTLYYLEKYYEKFKVNGDIQDAVEICKKHSIIMNKEVRIISCGIEKLGKVIDMDNDGELLVEYDNGEKEKVISGEVSIRGINGYV